MIPLSMPGKVKFMKKFNFSKGLVIGLLTLALCLTCFAAAKVSAEDAAATPTKSTAVSAEYDAAADTVKAGSNAYVYVLKAASGNKIKAGTGATGQMASNKISIADLGIKSTAKDVYLYVCDKEVEVDETVSANLTIKGNANKVVGVIDYTQADELDVNGVVGSVKVLSAYYVDKTTKKNVDIESAKLYWSPDQEKWYPANSAETTEGRKDAKNQTVANGFRGNDLAEMLEAGGTIYIKQAGTSGGDKTAQFGSKVVKVKIAKQAKAVKAKIDVSKDTIALKNGFDFAVALKSAGSTEYDSIVNWYTILPTLKTATVSTLGESVVGGKIGTDSTQYKPLDKKNSNAGKVVTVDGDDTKYYSYTKYAVKALSIDKLYEYLEKDFIVTVNDAEVVSFPTDYRIAIRKSATEKKPASAVTLIELAYKTEKPLVITQDNVMGQFLVSSADEFTKKGLTLNEVAGFPGYEGTNDLAIATTGFDSTFKVKPAANTIQGRDEGTSFEYAVVATADYFAEGDAAVDWTTVKWKKFDPSKLKITEKLSGKYNTVKGTKKTATLKATASADISKRVDENDDLERVIEDDYGRKVVNEDVIKTDTKALLLIRRAGDKASGTRASEHIALYVAKEGKKYNLYSTVSNGELAYKYTVKFAKYKAAEGTASAGFYIDDSIAAITGWTQNKNTGVTFEAPTGFEYWSTDKPDVATGVTQYYTIHNGGKMTPVYPAVTAGEGTDAIAKGQYTLVMIGNATKATEDTEFIVAIREFANVKVTGTAAIKGTTDTAVDNSSTQLASIVNGKVADYDSETNKFAVGNSTAVSAYVGDALEITLDDPAFAAPTGYILDTTNKVKAVDGQTYDYDEKVLTVTPTTAEETEYIVTYYVSIQQFTVTFETNGGSDVSSQTVNYGGVATKPATDPTHDADENYTYTFKGWFVDAECTAAFDFDATKITKATTVYAGWNKAAIVPNPAG